MKLNIALPASIVVSVCLLGLVHIRKEEQEKEVKQNSIGSIKLRVTQDVLREYLSVEAEMQDRFVKFENDQKMMEDEVNKLLTKADAVKGALATCEGVKKSLGDELASEETKLKNLQDQTSKETTSWKTELETLQKQLASRSSVCNFLKEGATEGRKLCGDPVEEPKPEAPKPEEPKAEAPKPEEPKAEAPKPEEPKAEAPKPEEPKAEAPKPEEPKAEAPKPEEPKAEAPKPEEPKAEAPKPEEPKAEAPKKR